MDQKVVRICNLIFGGLSLVGYIIGSWGCYLRIADPYITFARDQRPPDTHLR